MAATVRVVACAPRCDDTVRFRPHLRDHPLHFSLAPLAGRGSGRGGISRIRTRRESPSPEAFRLRPLPASGARCKHPRLRDLAAWSARVVHRV